MARGWTALILAGQRPGIDPLVAHFGGQWKALVPVAGKAMLSHVVCCLRQCPEVARIVVLAQEPAAMTAAVTAAGGADSILPSGNSISASILAIAGSPDAPWPLLVTTADHALLIPEMVAQFLRDAKNADLAVAMVEKKVMTARFPESRRTWLKFSDGHWSGANLFVLSGPEIVPALQLWTAAEKDRKVPWKLFRHFGPWLMLRALTRTIGLADGIVKGGRRLGLRARLVAMDDPVAAIDIDKPSDHSLAEKLMSASGCAS